MKKLLPIFLFFCCILLNAQKREYWLIDLQTQQRKAVKDSAAAVKFLDSLSQNRYYLTELKKVEADGLKTEIFYDKGRNFNEARVKLSDSLAQKLQKKTDFFTGNLDSLKQKINQDFIDEGFSFSRIKTRFLGLKSGVPEVELTVNTGSRRKIDGFVFKGYEKVPSRFVKNLEKEFKGKTYDDRNLVAINQSLQNHPFIALERPPQTLFTKDSTQVFLFLQKKKSNSFDGVIGFGNDKTDKFTFNGTLNVNFRNLFNGFESISVFWQRNPDKGQTFDLQGDIPYLFKSNLGTNLNVNIYRQDSTFATVKFLPSLYYHMSSRQKLGLRGTFESSTVIDSLYIQGADFSKKGAGVWYDYTEPSEIELFLYRTKLRAEYDLLSVLYGAEESAASQSRYYIFGERNFHLKGNHYLNLKAESAMLSSKRALTANELLRFGGWNSLRGFNENSLLGDYFILGGAEYRYVIGKQAFFDVFGQYAQLNNKILAQKPKLYSFGLGFNFFLPIGLMSFQLSNGNEFGNPIKFGDTKIHWGLLSRF